MTEPDLKRGEEILTALDRIVDSSDKIINLVHELEVEAGGDVDKVAEALIARYSNWAAIAGGATTLPGMIPGAGTLTVFLAGPLADMVLLLKWETELCLALAAAHGHDIRDPRERQLGYLLAAVSTAAVAKRDNAIGDGLSVSGTAIWNYTPRRISKSLTTMLAVVFMLLISRYPLRALLAIPFVGVGVGAGLNKLLTRRIGRLAHRDLTMRGEMTAAAEADESVGAGGSVSVETEAHA